MKCCFTSTVINGYQAIIPLCVCCQGQATRLSRPSLQSHRFELKPWLKKDNDLLDKVQRQAQLNFQPLML